MAVVRVDVDRVSITGFGKPIYVEMTDDVAVIRHGGRELMLSGDGARAVAEEFIRKYQKKG